MSLLTRFAIDYSYPLLRTYLFRTTQDDPEKAHKWLIEQSQLLAEKNLDRILFDNPANEREPTIQISNAAGFNKDGNIPSSFFKYLGFTRMVVGTVTADPWDGNKERPRMWRFPETESLVNFLGLPGVGATQVAANLDMFYERDIPLTISVMSTPGKTGEAQLEDIAKTMYMTAPYCDRFELNISCPNTEQKETYLENLSEMLGVFSMNGNGNELYVKLSPDLDLRTYGVTMKLIDSYPEIKGVTISNTTTVHDPQLVPRSPRKGGASGKAVRGLSNSRLLRLSMLKETHCLRDLELIACGGIDSVAEAIERVSLGANEIQLYTPLIFKGPKLIRQLRSQL